MRVFIHLPQSYPPLNNYLNLINIDQQKDYPHNNKIIVAHVNKFISTSDIYSLVQELIGLNSCYFMLKLIKNSKTKEKKIRIPLDWEYGHFMILIEGSYKSILQTLLQLQVKLLTETQDYKQKIKIVSQQSYEKYKQQSIKTQQIFKYINQMFKYLHMNQHNLFNNIVDIFLATNPNSVFKHLFMINRQTTGYNIIAQTIFYNKLDFLQNMLKNYSKYIDFNIKTIDGWFPFQIAIKTSNKKAIQIMINYSQQTNINLNYQSQKNNIIFSLLDTMNIDLIQSVVKKIPIIFQNKHKITKINAYQYLWQSQRYTVEQKKRILKMMNAKHFQFYDFYRQDQILYYNAKCYMPEINKTFLLKSDITYNPNLKIICGQIIKCKNPTFFSKYIFISVNSYVGAIETYQINEKLKLDNDKQKLQKYNKTNHLSFQQLQSVNIIDQKQKTWSLKKQWKCFYVKDKRQNKVIFACNHQTTANQWVQQIKQAKQAWQKNDHKHINFKLSKNFIHISDMQYKPVQNKKIQSVKLIELFSRTCSLYEPQKIKTSQQTSESNDVVVIKSKSHYNIPNKDLKQQDVVISLISLKYKDFKMLQLLGQGSFGQVFLVQCLKNKKYYALKVFQKKKIILSKQTKFVIAEVNILKQINHPFIIKLFFTFQTPNYIYLGLQYCQGKDLSKHINQQLTFPEQDVKLYAAQIILALQYLHSIGIIYRDLKPQNIMLGKDGHVLLVDFGLSKKTQNNFAKTFCGSPAYLSPEMLQKKGVGKETDFFSLGVVIFQLMYGEPPFLSDNIHVLYENIQNGRVLFPKKINKQLKSLLQGLLKKDPKQRLGCQSIDEIKNHEYFSEINWQKLMLKQINAPKRSLNFDDNQSEQQLISIFHDDFDYSQQNFKINRFKNFSFVRQQQFT